MFDAIRAVKDETADLPERVFLADDVRVGSVDIDIIKKEKNFRSHDRRVKSRVLIDYYLYFVRRYIFR